jgi:hypothetical protein
MDAILATQTAQKHQENTPEWLTSVLSTYQRCVDFDALHAAVGLLIAWNLLRYYFLFIMDLYRSVNVKDGQSRREYADFYRTSRALMDYADANDLPQLAQCVQDDLVEITDKMRRHYISCIVYAIISD